MLTIGPFGFCLSADSKPFFHHRRLDCSDGGMTFIRMWRICFMKLGKVKFTERVRHGIKSVLESNEGRIDRVKWFLTGYHAPYYVNVYEVDRCYGGSEEGGWYYDAGVPFEGVVKNSYACASIEEARAVQDALTNSLASYQPKRNRYSVIGGADIEAHIEDHPPKSYPLYRPYYY